MVAGDAPLAVLLSELELTERIREGRMSELWLARGPTGRSHLVRRWSTPITAADPSALVATLGRSAELAARVRHAALAPTLGAEREGEGFALIEPFVEGPSLDETTEPPSPTRAVSIVRPLAEALAALHAEGGFHGAVRRRRVIASAGGPVLVAASFGPLEASEEDPRWSTERPDTAREVDVYRAPERAEGQPAGPAADVFALGCLLYELASGTHPFEAPDAFRMRERARLAHFTPLDGAIGSIVAAALAREPGERPSAGGLRQSLLDLRG